MGDSRSSERSPNSSESLSIKQRRNQARRVRSGSEQSTGVFRGSRSSRFLQKATLTLGLLSATAAAAENAGVLPKPATDNFRNSRDVTVKKYEGPLKVADIRNKQIGIPAPQVNTPDVSASSDNRKEEVKSKTSEPPVRVESPAVKREVANRDPQPKDRGSLIFAQDSLHPRDKSRGFFAQNKRVGELESVLSKLSDKGILQKSDTPELLTREDVQTRLIRDVFPNSSNLEYAEINTNVSDYRTEVEMDVDLKQMQAFLKGWGKHLVDESRKLNLNPDIMKGMVLIESSGDPNAESPSGALGIAQLMPETAKRYGVNPRNPYESIQGMTKYMADLRDFFGGDMGMAIWAYHAGEGNVMNALRIYFKNTTGEDIGDFSDALEREDRGEMSKIEFRTRLLMKNHDINVY